MNFLNISNCSIVESTESSGLRGVFKSVVSLSLISQVAQVFVVIASCEAGGIGHSTATTAGLRRLSNRWRWCVVGVVGIVIVGVLVVVVRVAIPAVWKWI